MRVVLSGPPSVGKSTQGAALALQLGVPHLSSGEIIRAGARAGDDLSRRVAAIVSDGSLAPSDAIVGMVLHRLSLPDCEDGFVLDGFPRRPSEAHALIARHAIDAFVTLEAGVDVLDARLRTRRLKASFVRLDDDPSAFPGRVATYLRETVPVRESFAEAGVPTLAVDARPGPDEVLRALVAAMDAAGLGPEPDRAPAPY